MSEVEGLFAVLIENVGERRIIGPWKYEIAVDTYHDHVSYYAKYNPDNIVRLIKISFLD